MGDVTPGFVLCDPHNPIKTGTVFDAQVVMLDLKSIICAGYSCILHLQAMAEEVTIKALICLVDKKTGEKSKTRPGSSNRTRLQLPGLFRTIPSAWKLSRIIRS